MAGVLDIVQNQGSDNHLTVSCMRAMNKYLTNNLRQSKARIHSHDSNRSTRRHICRVCGENLADMANCTTEAPQNVNDSHECELMDIDEQPRTEIPQVGLVAPLANATATQAADEDYPSTEGSDEASNDVLQIISVVPAPKEISGQSADKEYPSTEGSDEAAAEVPQTGDRTAQTQSDAVAGDTPSTVAENRPSRDVNAFEVPHDVNQAFYIRNDCRSVYDNPEPLDKRGFEVPRNVNQAFYVPSSSDHSSDSDYVPSSSDSSSSSSSELSSQSPPDTPSKTVYRAGKKSASDPICKVQASSIRKANSSPISKASLIRKLVSRAIAETEPTRDKTPSEPPRSVNQTFCAPEGSGSGTEPEDDVDVTPFLPPRNVNQSIVIPDDIGSDATDEEPSPPQFNQKIRGSPTRFGGPQNANMSFMVHDDTSSGSPSPPGSKLGSSPPVMSNIPHTPVPSRTSYRNTPYPSRGSFGASPAPQNRSFRDTPITTSFYQPPSPSDGSDADTEDDAEKDVRNVTEKDIQEDANTPTKKAKPAGYRTFLELIKGSLGQPFNPDETLTSSELGTLSPCVRENDEAKESNEDVERVEETDEDTDEETNYDEDLIARSLITEGPNPTYVNPRPITPPRPATPIIFPDITLTDTETNRDQTIDFENAEDDPGCGIEYRKLEAVVTRVNKKFLRVPRTDILPKATRHVPSRRPLASWQQGGKRQPGPSNLKRARDDERTPETRKKIKFAFGSTEKDAEWSRTKSGPRIWFKDGMKYYDDPEVNPKAKSYKYNERPGMIQVQRTPQKSKAEEGSGTNSNKSDSEDE